MDESRNVQLLHLAVERGKARRVEVLAVHVGEYLQPPEAELPDAALQLGGCGFRFLHRERRQSDESLRAGDGGGGCVVHPAAQVGLGVLDVGRSGDELNVDAALVHVREALVQVRHAVAHVGRRAESASAVGKLRDG